MPRLRSYPQLWGGWPAEFTAAGAGRLCSHAARAGAPPPTPLQVLARQAAPSLLTRTRRLWQVLLHQTVPSLNLSAREQAW